MEEITYRELRADRCLQWRSKSQSLASIPTRSSIRKKDRSFKRNAKEEVNSAAVVEQLVEMMMDDGGNTQRMWLYI